MSRTLPILVTPLLRGPFPPTAPRYYFLFSPVRRISPNNAIGGNYWAGTFLYWNFRKGQPLPVVSRMGLPAGFLELSARVPPANLSDGDWCVFKDWREV